MSKSIARVSKAVEKMTWIELIMHAIQEKDATSPRPGDKDQYGNDLYLGESSDMGASFDLEEDDGRFPTVHGLIAKWILRNRSQYDLIDQFGFYQGIVHRNFDRAIERLVENGVNVYKVMENGGKGRNIAVLTLRPWYKNASMHNGDRLEKRIGSGVSSALRRAELTCPDRLNGMVDYAQEVAEGHRKNNMLENGEQGEAAGNYIALPVSDDMTQGHAAGNM